MSTRLLLTAFVATALAIAAPAGAAKPTTVVPLVIQPELELDGTERIYVGPVLLEPQARLEANAVDVTAVRELERFLRRLIKRETRLHLLPADDSLRPPSDDIAELAAMKEFWTEIGTATGAELIVAAAIDVKVLDRAGYQTEEYVSPQDGKTYFRQVLVEETGFNYDILLTVVSGVTGEVVYQEQITDFKERSERKLREFTDMFANLYTLEERLLGVFVPRAVPGKRYLFRR
jgi:hypothetical protein